MSAAQKVVVITGATGGIGMALSHRLAADGWKLHLCDVNLQRLTSLKAQLPAGTTVCESQLDSPAACAAALPEEPQAINALVHLAGIFEFHDFDNEGREVFERTMQHNATNAYDLSGAVEHRLVDDGRMVFTSSLAFRRGAVDNVSYTMAKGALVGLTRALSRRLAGRGILVNALAPGLIETAMLDQVMSGRDKQTMINSVPLQRLGKPSEIAGVIAFLLSDDASYITGQVINVDGGIVNS